MALDRWLFEQHSAGLHPPVLRFYTWQPAAISLGYHQRQIPDHWRHLTWQGEAIALIQRPSGGRAVLHQGDLTYAVIASGFAGSRMQAYEQICQFLMEGWRSLGIELSYGQAGRGYIHNPNCFGTATAADLVLPNGSKLIGSAQLRKGDAILQHGSIRLTPDPTLFQQVFGIEMEPLNLPAISTTDLIAKLTEAAQQCFGVEFQAQPLTDAEWQAILQQ